MTLNPGQWDTATFTIAVPANWAGMEDATYKFTATATYQADPTVNASALASLTVKATKHSMAEYIKLEIQQLKDDVAGSNVDPSFKYLANTYLQVALQEMDKAIEDIDRGWNVAAYCHLSRARGYIWKFEKLISSYMSWPYPRLPKDLADKWMQQAERIVQDINTAMNTPI